MTGTLADYDDIGRGGHGGSPPQGSLAAYERLCTALDAFHEADRAREKAIIALQNAAFAADEMGAMRADSTVAFAERRVKAFLESVG